MKNLLIEAIEKETTNQPGLIAQIKDKGFITQEDAEFLSECYHKPVAYWMRLNCVQQHRREIEIVQFDGGTNTLRKRNSVRINYRNLCQRRTRKFYLSNDTMKEELEQTGGLTPPAYPLDSTVIKGLKDRIDYEFPDLEESKINWDEISSVLANHEGFIEEVVFLTENGLSLSDYRGSLYFVDSFTFREYLFKKNGEGEEKWYNAVINIKGEDEPVVIELYPAEKGERVANA